MDNNHVLKCLLCHTDIENDTISSIVGDCDCSIASFMHYRCLNTILTVSKCPLCQCRIEYVVPTDNTNIPVI